MFISAFLVSQLLLTDLLIVTLSKVAPYYHHAACTVEASLRHCAHTCWVFYSVLLQHSMQMNCTLEPCDTQKSQPTQL